MTKFITILAQTENDQFTETVIEQAGPLVLGINRELSLVVLAQGDGVDEQAPAHKSVEILMDDMMLNLTDLGSNRGKGGPDAAKCLQESLDNINEYLSEQSTGHSGNKPGVAIAAIQFEPNRFSCCCMGALSCLKFSANRLETVGQGIGQPPLLGIDKTIQPPIVVQDLLPGDILMLSTTGLLSILDQEFIRITLSRFNDNLEMAMRQLNTRAARNGLQRKPCIILTRFDRSTANSRGWLGKLGNR